MKKLISVLLITCMLVTVLLPASGLAEERLIDQAKNLILLCKGDEIGEYEYTTVLSLLLFSIAEDRYEELSMRSSVLFTLQSTGKSEQAESLIETHKMIDASYQRMYLAIISDAQKCYESQTFSFDVLEKYVDAFAK